MIEEPSRTATLNPPGTKASVLITISTPGADTPICRLGNSEEVVAGLTVRQLIQRIISPNSLFSVGVPISQLQAESETALAIGEMLSADCCEVVASGKGPDGNRVVPLDKSAREVAREQIGTQGNRFLNISLEVRSIADSVAPSGEERRQTREPATLEAEPGRATGGAAPEASAAAWAEDRDTPPFASAAPSHEPEAGEVMLGGASAPSEGPDSKLDELWTEEFASPVEGGVSPSEPEEFIPRAAASAVTYDGPSEPAAGGEAESVASPAEAADGAPASREGSAGDIVAIVAERPKEEPHAKPKERKEYVRKADWLRAQFLPEVEALDFSGLFVGNLGLGIREERTRKNVVLADPSRITEVLLRANGYRRSGDNPKALICYQELVDMDPSNADFRFLLGKTLIELGQGEQAMEALLRAKELGHDGAEKELEALKRSGQRPKAALGFLRFWKQ